MPKRLELIQDSFIPQQVVVKKCLTFKHSQALMKRGDDSVPLGHVVYDSSIRIIGEGII